MFEQPEITAIYAAIILLVGGFTVRAWLARAKLEGMVEIMNAFVAQVSPHYDGMEPFPEDLGWAFIKMRSDVADAWFDVGRINAYNRHIEIVAARMAEACVEHGRRQALREVRSGV